MAFKELEWSERLTDAVKIHNEAETDAGCSASGAWRGASVGAARSGAWARVAGSRGTAHGPDSVAQSELLARLCNASGSSLGQGGHGRRGAGACARPVGVGRSRRESREERRERRERRGREEWRRRLLGAGSGVVGSIKVAARSRGQGRLLVGPSGPNSARARVLYFFSFSFRISFYGNNIYTYIYTVEKNSQNNINTNKYLFCRRILF
jgi:hypothetical protein